MIMIGINLLTAVRSSNCPLLQSFINDTGMLIVNKTAMIGMESNIHCQWLVVSSIRQVRIFENEKINLFVMCSVLSWNLIMYGFLYRLKSI